MKTLFTKALITFACLNILNVLSIYIYQLATDNAPIIFKIDKAQQLLVFATHQDDGVISAGGLAIQNEALGGTTTIVYLTRETNDEISEIRKNEAINAWKLVGNRVSLIFLDKIGTRGWDENEIQDAKNALSNVIANSRPSLVIIPLKEGGNAEHDLLNSILRDIIPQQPESYNVLQAAEYNSILSVEDHPAKVFWFLVRIAPKLPFLIPNSGLISKNQKILKMTEAEQTLKNQMLLTFESQSKIIPLNQFGFPDRFDDSTEYNRFTLNVLGKTMTFWTLTSIALLSSCIILSGIVISLHLKAWFSIVTVFGITFIFLSSRMTLKEDLTYFLLLICGFCLGHLVLFYKHIFPKDTKTKNT